MGNAACLSPSSLKALKDSSKFDEDTIRKLFRRFKKIDKDKSGTLSIDELLAIPELENNPLVRRVTSIFDEDSNGQIEFDEFIKATSWFSEGESFKAKKLWFAFKVYDVNNDGYISNGDLFRMLKIMVGDNLNDVQLQQLVDRTILEGDLDRDGRLSFQEFVKMIDGSGIEQKLVIDMKQ